MTLAEILQMIRTPQPSGLGQVSNMEADAMKAALAGAAMEGIPRYEGMMNKEYMYDKRLAPPVNPNVNINDMIDNRRFTPPQNPINPEDMIQLMGTAGMGASPALSIPANEMQRNYADGQAPIAVGGGLLADEAQMLMNTAYDMSAPREMRINAINRLRELGY